LKYTDLKTVPDMIAKIDSTPLALYVFTEDMEEAAYIRDNTSSGGMCINDAMGHMFVTSFAFGGFGTSGMGSYRGKASIDTFSHRKSVANVPTSDMFEGLLEWRYADGSKEVLAAKHQGFRANLEGKLEG
jgi:acyl-CoA reductase-like NAD-dependent aldehyde dehydrogenase